MPAGESLLKRYARDIVSCPPSGQDTARFTQFEKSTCDQLGPVGWDLWCRDPNYNPQLHDSPVSYTVGLCYTNEICVTKQMPLNGHGTTYASCIGRWGKIKLQQALYARQIRGVISKLGSLAGKSRKDFEVVLSGQYSAATFF